jgi:hypothetical protein
MADNLSINITADTASLRAQLAIAQADVRAYGAEVRKLAGELRNAGDEAKAGLQGQLLQAAEHLDRAGAAAARFRGELAPVREAAHEGGSALGVLKENAVELAGILGVGFGAEKILEQVKMLAEMGEKTENIAAAIGTTPARFSELSGALQLVGGDAEAAQRSIRQLERNIETALEDPKSKQALNFGALGIDRSQLEAAQRDVIGFLEGPFADAYKKFVVDSANPGTGTAEFTELMGRGMQNLIPLIKEGSAGVAELVARAKALGGALSDAQIKDLAETAKILNEVGSAFTGLKVKIFEEFKNPIDESATSLRDFLTDGRDLITFLHEVAGAGQGAADFLNKITGAGSPEAVKGGSEKGGWWESVDEWIRSHSGIGGKLLPNSWTETHPFFGPRAPGAATFGGGDRHDEGDSHKGQITAWLAEHGYDADHAAAVLGNASVESSFRPDARNATGHFGLFQWDQERQKPLGGSTDITKQMELMDAELQKLDPAFKTASGSVKELTRRFEQKFERSGGQLEGQREAAAHEIAGGKNVTPSPLPVKQATEDLKEQTRALEDELKLKEKDFELETVNARGDQKTLDDINRRKRAFEEEILVKKQLAIAEAGNRTEGLVTGDTTSIQVRMKGSDIEARKEQIRSEEEAARLAISRQETERKIADQKEATDLQRVEGQRRTGDLTIDAAAQAEEQIVQKHATAVGEILAKETELAQGSIKLAQEVANRKEELIAKSAEKIKQIDDKASEEHAARAHSIDAELAGAASGAIVNTAWGKGGGIQQQLGGLLQGQEKKALDAVGTRLLDASGVGKLFEGLGDKLFSFLPGAGKTAGETVLGTASTTAAGQVAALGAAASVAAAQMSAGGAAGAVKGGAGLLGDLPIIGGLFGSGEAVAGIGGAATLSSGTSALDALAPALLAAEGGAVIPSAAGGMTVNDGKGGRLIIGHPDEMVLPSGISVGLQDMIAKGSGWSIPRAPAPNTISPAPAGGGQGGDTHITHNWDIDGVLSTHDFQRLLMANSDTIARAGARASRDFSPHAR